VYNLLGEFFGVIFHGGVVDFLEGLRDDFDAEEMGSGRGDGEDKVEVAGRGEIAVVETADAGDFEERFCKVVGADDGVPKLAAVALRGLDPNGAGRG